MELTGMIFLFAFLPLSLAVYYIANDRAKEYVLFGISLLFYSFGSPDYLLLFLVSIAVTVLIGRSLAGRSGGGGKTDSVICRDCVECGAVSLL